MQRLGTILLLLMLPLTVLAQEGTVRYEQTVQLDIQLPPEMQQMADQIPSSRTSYHQLLFDDTASLMKEVASDEAEDMDREFAGNGGTVRFRMSRASQDNAIYTHFDDETLVERRDFLGRTFRITGTASTLPWRLTDERSEFLGYMCQKAVATRDSSTVEAWFTPEIPVPAGPGIYSGLPGLVLVVTIDDGQRSYVAKELSLEPLEETIAPPAKGKEVTRAEYDEIVEEKMEEMGATRGGSNARIIFRNQ